MVTITNRVFSGGYNDEEEDGWRYITFLDRCPNRQRRHWQLAIGPDGPVQATMYRSNTDVSPFQESHRVPQKMAFALLAAAIRDGLVKTTRR